jgi:nucleotide-binding universal stress UspA family protein
MFKRVLLCFDGTESGRRALRKGAELAIELRAEIFILSIVPSDQVDPGVAAGFVGQACFADTASRYQKQLDESIDLLKMRGVKAAGFIASGDTIDQILLHARKLAVDLIVVGYYPRPAGGFWWSSTKRSSLAEQAGCCVLVAVG